MRSPGACRRSGRSISPPPTLLHGLPRRAARSGQATVYRTIDRLAASGELRKYIVDGSTAACYQKSGGKTGCREHFHLKCEGCGRLIHVECDELAKIASHMEKEHGFAVDSSKTVFYGICRECGKSKPGKIGNNSE